MSFYELYDFIVDLLGTLASWVNYAFDLFAWEVEFMGTDISIMGLMFGSLFVSVMVLRIGKALIA